MKKILLTVLISALSAMGLMAEIRLPEIIGDNMVLQRNSNANLWGWADSGSKITVTVSWNKDKYTATADENGRWLVAVATPEATHEPQTITIKEGKEKVTINNILIGEVWFCSGQSNMEMPIRGFINQPIEGAGETIANSGRYKNVRVACVPKTGALEPQEEVKGKWYESNPENARRFSATAYYFAMRMNEMLGIPVGIICSSWGGASVEGWMPKELLASLGDKNIEKRAADEKLRNARPTIMYNAMLYPLKDYTIAGYLWYQGCANVGRYKKYAQYKAEMVKHWRKLWGQGELPFYFVEIAPYDFGRGKGWLLREAQRESLKLIPNSGMAATGDLVKPYEEKIIHPRMKKEVGDRLAYLALEHTYGVKGIEGDAPLFTKMELLEDGKEAKLHFTACREGFSASEDITGFEVAGEDKVFHPAKAKRNRDRTITVSSEDVQKIAAVRYLYRNYYIANLFSMEGLPVLPFRTDDWE